MSLIEVDEMHVGDKIKIIFKNKAFKPITGRIIKFWNGEIHLDRGEGRTIAIALGDPLIKRIKNLDRRKEIQNRNSNGN